MLQLLLFCFFAYCWYKMWPTLTKFFNHVNGSTATARESRTYHEPSFKNPIFDYVLGTLLTSLSAEERVGIRDNVDDIFSAVFNYIDRATEIDSSKISVLANVLELNSHGLSDKNKELAKTLFNALEKAMRSAPASYNRKVTLFQLFIFIKRKV